VDYLQSRKGGGIRLETEMPRAAHEGTLGRGHHQALSPEGGKKRKEKRTHITKWGENGRGKGREGCGLLLKSTERQEGFSFQRGTRPSKKNPIVGENCKKTTAGIRPEKSGHQSQSDAMAQPSPGKGGEKRFLTVIWWNRRGGKWEKAGSGQDSGRPGSGTNGVLRAKKYFALPRQGVTTSK